MINSDAGVAPSPEGGSLVPLPPSGEGHYGTAANPTMSIVRAVLDHQCGDVVVAARGVGRIDEVLADFFGQQRQLEYSTNRGIVDLRRQAVAAKQQLVA